MSPWQEWKAKNLAAQQAGKVTPMALLNPDTPMVSEEEQQARYSICQECPHLLVTKQCSKCGCYMPSKTGLLHAVCPVGNW